MTSILYVAAITDAPSLHILRDSGASTSALALFFVMQNSGGCLALCLSFGLAGGAAGSVSILSAAGTR